MSIRKTASAEGITPEPVEEALITKTAAQADDGWQPGDEEALAEESGGTE